MVPYNTSKLPLNLRTLAITTSSPYQVNPGYGFGGSPFREHGLRGCGCSPSTGCSCAPGLAGLGQATSLDSIIQSAANWLGGFAQSQLPASAAVPPQYGSTGALAAQLQGWLPYIVIGALAYMVIKR